MSAINDRQLLILDMLNRENELSTPAIAQALSVSEVTVRKDVKLLEQKGLLRRAHGTVMAASSDSVAARMAVHYEVKRRIAQAAVELVERCETVMVESGSSCMLFAQALMAAGKDVTLITNSAFLAQSVGSAPGGRVILLGGDYQPDSQVCTGPLTELSAREFHVNKLFVGVDGYTIEHGFSGRNYNRVCASRAMMSSCEQLIVLTDSSKFGRRSVARSFSADEVSVVVTDRGISEDMAAALQTGGACLITV